MRTVFILIKLYVWAHKASSATFAKKTFGPGSFQRSLNPININHPDENDVVKGIHSV